MNGASLNTVSSPGPNGPAGAGVDLSLEALAEHFHLPIAEAARQIGVCATVLKKICRKYVLMTRLLHIESLTQGRKRIFLGLRLSSPFAPRSPCYHFASALAQNTYSAHFSVIGLVATFRHHCLYAGKGLEKL